jgi:hypothetical protein
VSEWPANILLAVPKQKSRVKAPRVGNSRTDHNRRRAGSSVAESWGCKSRREDKQKGNRALAFYK